jgi:hypothetical protein
MLTLDELNVVEEPTNRFQRDITTSPLPWLGGFSRTGRTLIGESIKDGFLVRVERDLNTGATVETVLRSVQPHGLGAVRD